MLRSGLSVIVIPVDALVPLPLSRSVVHPVVSLLSSPLHSRPAGAAWPQPGAALANLSRHCLFAASSPAFLWRIWFLLGVALLPAAHAFAGVQWQYDPAASPLCKRHL